MGAQGHSINQNILFQDNQRATRMENIGNKSCSGNFRHIDIHYLFVKYRVDSNKILIPYCSTDHMLVDFFTKYLQGSLFVKFREVIIVWKHIDTLHMGLTSTKESVVNMDNVDPNKELIKPKVETKDKNIRRKRSHTYIVINGNKIWHVVGTEISHDR